MTTVRNSRQRYAVAIATGISFLLLTILFLNRPLPEWIAKGPLENSPQDAEMSDVGAASRQSNGELRVGDEGSIRTALKMPRHVVIRTVDMSSPGLDKPAPYCSILIYSWAQDGSPGVGKGMSAANCSLNFTMEAQRLVRRAPWPLTMQRGLEVSDITSSDGHIVCGWPTKDDLVSIAMTDERGVCECELPYCPVLLVAEKEGLASAETLVAGEGPTNVVLCLRTARSISGSLECRGLPFQGQVGLPVLMFQGLEKEGCWPATLNADGSWSACVGATSVIPFLLEPIDCGIATSTSLIRVEPGQTGIVIDVVKLPSIEVVDDATEQPVERFDVDVSGTNAASMSRVTITAPHGVAAAIVNVATYEAAGQRLVSLKVSAPGYQSRRLPTQRLDSLNETRISLIQGQDPLLVILIAKPEDGLGASLRISDISGQPGGDGGRRVYDGALPKDGVRVPQGRYRVKVEGNGHQREMIIEVVKDTNIEMDMSIGGSMRLRCVASEFAEFGVKWIDVIQTDCELRRIKPVKDARVIDVDCLNAGNVLVRFYGLVGREVHEPMRAVIRIGERKELVVEEDPRTRIRAPLLLINGSSPIGEWSTRSLLEGSWDAVGTDGRARQRVAPGSVLQLRSAKDVVGSGTAVWDDIRKDLVVRFDYRADGGEIRVMFVSGATRAPALG